MRKQPIRESIRAVASTITTTVGVVESGAKYANLVIRKELVIAEMEAVDELVALGLTKKDAIVRLGL